ncbi:MAG: hypothetical protein FWF51_02850 [Chitinivibrionia bacterium]|nr:hypothetical protein [Chitinivibrionia bacterium]
MRALDFIKYFLAVSVIATGALAQDLITMRDGSEVQAVVVDVGTDAIKYKKWHYQDGPFFVVSVSKVFSIRYRNGEKDVFEAKEKPSVASSQQPLYYPVYVPQYGAPTAPTHTVGAAAVKTQQVSEFTGGQRWGTWFLNGIFPGSGSYGVMKDVAGGTTNLLLASVGYPFIFADSEGGPLSIIGATALTVKLIYNIARSASYGKSEEPQKQAKGFEPTNIRFSLKGNELEGKKFELAYKIAF